LLAVYCFTARLIDFLRIFKIHVGNGKRTFASIMQNAILQTKLHPACKHYFVPCKWVAVSFLKHSKGLVTFMKRYSCGLGHFYEEHSAFAMQLRERI
jgi:hypothetical protein